jgi:hypothetical protein
MQSRDYRMCPVPVQLPAARYIQLPPAELTVLSDLEDPEQLHL